MTEYIGWLDDDHAPVVDMAQEVVRCRDCRWLMSYWQADYCDYLSHAIEHDGFCAWGERRCE